MNAATLTTRGSSLKQLLVVDALTCLITGIVLVTATGFLVPLLGLPEGLLHYAGLILFPCAALMFIAARTEAKALVWIVILGNFAWAFASFVVALSYDPTAMGLIFVLAQALLVAALGWLEWRASR